MTRRALAVALLVAAALVAAAAAAGCARDRASAGTAENPFVLLVSPAHATPASAAQLAALLSERSGLTVDVEVAPAGADGVQAAGSPHVDAGLLSVFEYLLARQEYGVEAGLQIVREGARDYRGVLVVRDDAPIHSLAELQGKTVAYAGPTSTTGYLLALQALATAGVTTTPLFVRGHDAAVAALRDGRADAAATYGSHESAGLRVLAETGAVPNEPVFFAGKVPAPLRERIANALVDLGATDAGRALLHALAGIDGFAPVSDDAYGALHDLLAATQRDVAALVPGGPRLVEWNRVPQSPLGPL